jgi:hypothetical protein
LIALLIPGRQKDPIGILDQGLCLPSVKVREVGKDQWSLRRELPPNFQYIFLVEVVGVMVVYGSHFYNGNIGVMQKFR